MFVEIYHKPGGIKIKVFLIRMENGFLKDNPKLNGQ